MLNTQTTDAAGSGHNEFWNQYYTGIGQCLLLSANLTAKAQKTESATKPNASAGSPRPASSKAYYHFLALRLYGPIPLTTTLDVPENSHDISGRTSFETCVNYIAGELDGAANPLWSVSDSTPWKRRRARTRHIRDVPLDQGPTAPLHAASPLWNGEFPYAEWGDLERQSGQPVRAPHKRRIEMGVAHTWHANSS